MCMQHKFQHTDGGRLLQVIVTPKCRLTRWMPLSQLCARIICHALPPANAEWIMGLARMHPVAMLAAALTCASCPAQSWLLPAPFQQLPAAQPPGRGLHPPAHCRYTSDSTSVWQHGTAAHLCHLALVVLVAAVQGFNLDFEPGLGSLCCLQHSKCCAIQLLRAASLTSGVSSMSYIEQQQQQLTLSASSCASICCLVVSSCSSAFVASLLSLAAALRLLAACTAFLVAAASPSAISCSVLTTQHVWAGTSIYTGCSAAGQAGHAFCSRATTSRCSRSVGPPTLSSWACSAAARACSLAQDLVSPSKRSLMPSMSPCSCCALAASCGSTYDHVRYVLLT